MSRLLSEHAHFAQGHQNMAAAARFGRCSASLLRSQDWAPWQRAIPLTTCQLSSQHRWKTTSSKATDQYDVVVVGAGIVGLATARELNNRYPNLSFAVIEKEKKVAPHQSGHNSGVIHAGIYYTPGSLKAQLCVQGLKLMYEYCDKNEVPYKRVGKLIVAVDEEENSRLEGIFERGLQNEVPGLKLVGPDEIREIEPNCKGLRAIHSPYTGIVDYGEVTRSYAKTFAKAGGNIHLNFEVNDFKESTENQEYPITISSKDQQSIKCKYLITCGGLHADRLAALTGCNPIPKVVPFRGEYLLLKPEKADLIRGNIYPVPNPKFPFLGVHFTPRVNGEVWLGPNAVLAFKREGYNYFQISPRDMAEAVAFRGLRKLVLGNLNYAFSEFYRGINIAAQVKTLQRFVPSLKVSDVTRGPAGVRAQALDDEGRLVDDFVFDTGTAPKLGKRMLHVRNAPSPAATSSLAIAKMVADKASETFHL